MRRTPAIWTTRILRRSNIVLNYAANDAENRAECSRAANFALPYTPLNEYLITQYSARRPSFQPIFLPSS